VETWVASRALVAVGDAAAIGDAASRVSTNLLFWASGRLSNSAQLAGPEC
jgi:hypothetical protein